MWRIIICLFVTTLSLSLIGGSNANQEEVLTTTLATGKTFPLVGIGVGNLAHDSIIPMLAYATSSHGYRLVDTAHASRNERLVGEGISRHEVKDESDQVHVITKIWYTHLGYNRTKLAVQESLNEILEATKQKKKSNSNIQVHILLHWPYCMDDIEWMNCEEEEKNLPQSVKDLGPPPHLDKENAWKESWRALEDIYLEQDSPLASIGVSNFEHNLLMELEDKARVFPHILQQNVWVFVFNDFLIDFLHNHHVHIQVYNVMNGILGRGKVAPNAYASLESIAQGLGDDTNEYSPAQVVLAWLAQKGVSVIPRTSRPDRLVANGPAAIASVPQLSAKQDDQVRRAVRALLRGQDLNPPKATFTSASSVLHLFWLNEDTGEEILVKEELQPEEEFHTLTSTGHKFVAYDETKSRRQEYIVEADYGDHDTFQIEL